MELMSTSINFNISQENKTKGKQFQTTHLYTTRKNNSKIKQDIKVERTEKWPLNAEYSRFMRGSGICRPV